MQGNYFAMDTNVDKLDLKALEEKACVFFSTQGLLTVNEKQ